MDRISATVVVAGKTILFFTSSKISEILLLKLFVLAFYADMFVTQVELKRLSRLHSHVIDTLLRLSRQLTRYD